MTIDEVRARSKYYERKLILKGWAKGRIEPFSICTYCAHQDFECSNCNPSQVTREVLNSTSA